MGNKKIIIIIFIVVIAISVSIIGTKNTPGDAVWKKYYERSIDTEAAEEDEPELPTEITIYDIEDGYMKVRYNADATQHAYNWEKFLNNDDGVYSYEDEKYISKQGIDVSSYNGVINWKKVKESGVEFAILRIGCRGYGETGKLVEDSTFETNYKNAIKEGIEIGVYFFSQAMNEEEAEEEADFVLKRLEGKDINYPVIYELEKIKKDSARTDNLTAEEITNIALKFCNKVKEHGYKPCVYGNAKTFTTKMKLEQFNECSKWYADYQENPIYIYDFQIWKYTESGNVSGIRGKVNRDLIFIKKDDSVVVLNN